MRIFRSAHERCAEYRRHRRFSGASSRTRTLTPNRLNDNDPVNERRIVERCAASRRSEDEQERWCPGHSPEPACGAPAGIQYNFCDAAKRGRGRTTSAIRSSRENSPTSCRRSANRSSTRALAPSTSTPPTSTSTRTRYGLHCGTVHYGIEREVGSPGLGVCRDVPHGSVAFSTNLSLRAISWRGFGSRRSGRRVGRGYRGMKGHLWEGRERG